MGLEDHASVQRQASRAEREAEGLRAEGKGEKKGAEQILIYAQGCEQTFYPQHFHIMLWEMKKKIIMKGKKSQ